jgi:hypothetical protein
MIRTSDEIRERIKNAFDKDKGIFQSKLWKTSAIKDKKFFCPKFNQLKEDYQEARIKTLSDFNIKNTDIKSLASNPETIFDCDNMARKLRQTLQDIHYARFLNGLHNIPFEYCAFQITEERHAFIPMSSNLIFHDFVMVFCDEDICFADFMRDDAWRINTNKPTIVSIGE